MDFERSTLLVLLSITTLVVVLTIGIVLRVRAERAKKKGEHSAFADDPRMTHKEPRSDGS